MGGLSKKVYQIHNLTQSENEKRLLLDAGNLLFKRPKINEGPSQERLTAESIINIYKGLKFDAVGVGPMDLSGSIDLLINDKTNGFPWVSANLFDGHGKPLFNQWIGRKVGDIEIRIIALTGSIQPASPDLVRKKPETVLPDLLATIKKDHKDAFIILLSTLTNEENKHIAAGYPDINLIIGADSRSNANIAPHSVQDCLLTQISKQGKYQGVLQINLGTQREWGKDNAKILADLQNKLGSLNWQLRRLEKKAKLPENEEKFQSSIVRLHKEKKAMNKKIGLAKETLAKEKKDGVVNDQFTYRFIGLEKNMPNDQPTVEKLTLLNQKIRALHKESKQTKKMSALTQDMIGYQVCETCHKKQVSFWKTTKHSSAFATLEVKKKQLDLECLPCHLTINASDVNYKISPNMGYLSYPVELQSVGCESCHGKGKKHSIDPDTFKVVRLPEETTCLVCHTPEHDDNFDYSVKVNRISCPAE